MKAAFLLIALCLLGIYAENSDNDNVEEEESSDYDNSVSNEGNTTSDKVSDELTDSGSDFE